MKTSLCACCEIIMRHWLFVLNFHFSSFSNRKQTLVNIHTYVFSVPISFPFYFSHILLRIRIQGPLSLPVCGSFFLFSWPCSGCLFLGCCLLPGLQPSECCSPLGCLFVLLFIMPLFNCHCGKTGMCHCLLLAAWARKPNYQGSQCLLTIAVKLHVCVRRLFWWAAVPGPTGSDGRGWLWLQWWQQGVKNSRQAHKGLPMCCHPGTTEQPATTVCLLTTKLLSDV